MSLSTGKIIAISCAAVGASFVFTAFAAAPLVIHPVPVAATASPAPAQPYVPPTPSASPSTASEEDTDTLIMSLVWAEQTTEDKATMCAYVNAAPHTAYESYVSGFSKTTPPSFATFDAFYSAQC